MCLKHLFSENRMYIIHTPVHAYVLKYINPFNIIAIEINLDMFMLSRVGTDLFL